MSAVEQRMQRPECFMREFFRARIIEEQKLQASRGPFRQKFFTEDCRWESRAGTLEMIQSEEVVAVDAGESEARVTTTYDIPYAGVFRKHRLLYHLQPVKDAWLIRCVEMECPACGGRGGDDCTYCKGKHWLSSKQGREQP